MRNYLFITAAIFMSCNSNSIERSYEHKSADSLIAKADSINEKIASIDSFAMIVYSIKNKINRLEKEKLELQSQVNQATVYYPEIKKEDYVYDDRDSRIKNLSALISQYEKEINSLKRKLVMDSVYHSRTETHNIERNETLIEKPNDNSLIVELDRKMRNNQEIPLQGIDVFIIPYSKKIKKLMQYDIYCEMRDIKSMNARQAGYYEGNYFFNDIPPGKYLIKVCYYYGGYKLIERVSGYQVVAMKVAPPIQ
jgi:hypothetical protein